MIEVRIHEGDDDRVTLALIDSERPELDAEFELDVEYVSDASRVIVEAKPLRGATLELVVRTPD